MLLSTLSHRQNAGSRLLLNSLHKTNASFQAHRASNGTDLSVRPSRYAHISHQCSRPAAADARRHHTATECPSFSFDSLTPPSLRLCPRRSSLLGPSRRLVRPHLLRRQYTDMNAPPSLPVKEEQGGPKNEDASNSSTAVPLSTQKTRNGAKSSSRSPRQVADDAASQLQEILRSKKPRLWDTTWKLYLESGSPKSLASPLLQYLSLSRRPTDVERCITLFDSIENQLPGDFCCIVRSLISDNRQVDLIRSICYQAITGPPRFHLCWYLAFYTYSEKMDWNSAMKLWSIKPDDVGENLHDALKRIEFASISSLQRRLIVLLDELDTGSRSLVAGMKQMINFLVFTTVSSPDLLKNVTVDSIKEMFTKLERLHLCDQRHYFLAVSSLAAFDVKSGVLRSMVLYTHVRDTQSSARPPRPVVAKLLEILSKLGVQNGVDLLMSDFRHFHGKPIPSAYMHAMKVFSRKGNSNKVKSLLSDYIDDYGKPQDIRILTPLLHSYAVLGQVSEARRLFALMNDRYGLQPDAACWNVVISSYERNTDVTGAFDTFQEMLQSGCVPNQFTFTVLLSLLAKRGDIEASLQLFDKAKAFNIPIDVPLIRPLILSLCEAERYSAAERLVEEVTKLKIPGPPTQIWNTLLWKYAFLVDYNAMLQVQEKMLSMKVPFDEMTYAALMLPLILTGKTGAAVLILEKLHRSRRIHATEFHYALVLTGYLRENNRDMVQVIYNEITRRFHDPDPSSKLAMLKSKIRRDLQIHSEEGGSENGRKLELTHAEQFLSVIMDRFDIKTWAIKRPQPGTGRRTIKEAFPSVYYEQLMEAYGSHSSLDDVERLLHDLMQQRENLFQNNKADVPEGRYASLELFRVMMVSHLRVDDHTGVERSWRAAFRGTIKVATPTTLVTPNEDSPKIINAYRFSLSYCLSLYMRSLASLNLHARIDEVIEEVQDAGFVLTTDNWALYIKLFCLSEQPQHQMKAFELFETHFVDNFPGWNNIRRGYAIRPPFAPKTLDLLDRPRIRGKNSLFMGKKARRAFANIQPDYMQPTYSTTVYLASAFLGFQQRSVTDGGAEIGLLNQKAPKSLYIISQMPDLREKYQSVLIRGREPLPPSNQPTEVLSKSQVDGSGILEAGEPRLDTSPAEFFDEETQTAIPDHYRPHMDFDLSRTSEPSPEDLKELIEQDNKWRAQVKSQLTSPRRPSNIDDIIRREDRLDVEAETLFDPKRFDLREFMWQSRANASRSRHFKKLANQRRPGFDTHSPRGMVNTVYSLLGKP